MPKRWGIFVLLAMMSLPLMAQEQPQTLPPNYRLISKIVQRPDSPYYYDSLLARFSRCDTSFTIDDARCLYYGGTEVSITDCYRRYRLLLGRFGRHEGRANDVWWQYQMLLSAVWSTGDGSKEHPLHVQSREDLITLEMLEGADGNPISTKVRRRMIYECHPVVGGGVRWYCYRK